jgi:4,5-dihydroxyphthalate decarboxylase
MSKLKLTLACWDYDRTRPLIDGRVQAEGIDLEIKVLRPRETFPRMLENKEFEVSELSLGSYVSLIGRGDCPFVALPVALSKMLRHEYGVTLEDIQWFIGGMTTPTQRPLIPLKLSDKIKVEFLPADRTLEGMLESGDLDALLAIFIPSIFEKGSLRIARLFPNYYEVEQDYYHRTGIFPIMHTVVLRDDVYRDHPWAARNIYRAFCEARDLAVDGLYDTDALRLSLPWLIHHIEETWRVMGKDFWAYGLEPNRPTLKAIGEYVYEQGLSPRIVSPEELFAADVES